MESVPSRLYKLIIYPCSLGDASLSCFCAFMLHGFFSLGWGCTCRLALNASYLSGFFAISFWQVLLWPLERCSASGLVWREMRSLWEHGWATNWAETDGEIQGAGSRNSAGKEARIGVLKELIRDRRTGIGAPTLEKGSGGLQRETSEKMVREAELTGFMELFFFLLPLRCVAKRIMD